MFYGKPVIAADLCGTTEFARNGDGFPPSYKLIELKEDRSPYARGNVWADPSVEHLGALMAQLQGNAALCAAAQVHATELLPVSRTPGLGVLMRTEDADGTTIV